jgi:hypothetical protein
MQIITGLCRFICRRANLRNYRMDRMTALTNSVTSYCGISCQRCRYYVSPYGRTSSEKKLDNNNSTTQRAEKDQICHGCFSENRLTHKRCEECKIRSCAVNRGIESCSDCSDYICETMISFFQQKV